MKRFLVAAFLFLLPALAGVLAPTQAAAQSTPPCVGTYSATVPCTAGQWTYAWQSKQDYTGASPCSTAGCTLTGKLNLLPSATTTAGLNCGVGTAPTSPVNGDFWCTSVGVYAYVNGTTVQLGGTGSTVTVPGGGTGQTSFTANRPILGNGTSALAQGTVTSTNGSTLFATASGTPGNGNCAAWNNGNVIDAGVGACGGTGGSGTVTMGTQYQLAYYSSSGASVAGLGTCVSGFYVTNGIGAPSCTSTMPTNISESITGLGTIVVGTWNSTLISPTYGGTGINNGSFTTTLAGNLSTTGAYNLALNLIGATNITLPTSGNIPNSAGTSGGIPYYNTSSTIASSAALTANLPVFGGGAGAAPFVGTRLGNTTKAQMANATTSPVTGDCVSYDANGNTQDSGQPCGSTNAAPVLLVTLTCSGSSCTDVGSSCGATGCLSSTYSRYTIVWDSLTVGSPASNIVGQIQVYIGAFQTSGNYSYTFGTQSTTADFLPFMLSSGSAQPESPGASGSVTVFNPSATGAPVMWVGQGGWLYSVSQSAATELLTGAWQSNGAVTGFRFCFSSSISTSCTVNFTGGTIKVYGNP